MDTSHKTVQNALAGSKTEELLKQAARGEAQAFTKYMLFASLAGDEGYEPIRRLFIKTAGNEKEHAELWYGYLDELGSSEENLENALSGERFESKTFYPDAARVAKEEGFDEIAQKFAMTGAVEADHAAAFGKMADALCDGKLYTGDADTGWICSNCGYRTKGNEPPERCPLCSYPKGFFDKAENAKNGL